jgi:hypothetical protein
MEPTSSTWATSIQPRRRPSMGSVNRSRSGDQRNLRVYGSPTRAMKPMTVRSTPSSVIHACSTVMVRRSGSPQLKPITPATSIRRLRMIFKRAGISLRFRTSGTTSLGFVEFLVLERPNVAEQCLVPYRFLSGRWSEALWGCSPQRRIHLDIGMRYNRSQGER